jgi:hypothetical protein
MQRYDQQRKYTKFEYDEYTKDGVYIAKRMYVVKGKYIEYAKDGVNVPKGEYGMGIFCCACSLFCMQIWCQRQFYFILLGEQQFYLFFQGESEFGKK